MLVTDQANEIARDFELAARGCLTPVRRPSIARRSEGNGDRYVFRLTCSFINYSITSYLHYFCTALVRIMYGYRIGTRL